jgi:protein-S-isoprenylcysteine O-methyltransferase Ste14
MSSLESKFPPALFAAGLLTLGYGLVDQTGPRRLVIALYLGWTLLELRVTLRKKADETGGNDGGSMPLYGLARGAVVAAAVFGPNNPHWTGWQTASVVVFIVGIWLRLDAIYQLGRFYSHQVRTLSDHTIVQTGPYRFIRHPAYAGMIVAHVGFVAIFANPFSVAALLGLLVPAIVNRIRVEEQTLMALSAYPDYARDHKRLIPAVW